MIALIQSPFFLLFCATSGLGAYLGHRLYVLRLQPGLIDRGAAILAGALSVALSATCYFMRLGSYCPAHIDPATASVVAAFTGVGIAFVCLKIVLHGDESTD